MEFGLAELHEGGADGILIVQAGTNLNIPGRSFEVAFANNIPTMYANSFWTKIGVLATYGPDHYVSPSRSPSAKNLNGNSTGGDTG